MLHRKFLDIFTTYMWQVCLSFLFVYMFVTIIQLFLMCFCVTRFHHHECNFVTPTNHSNYSVQNTLFSRIRPQNLMTAICRVIKEDRSVFWELTVTGYCEKKSSHDCVSKF
jgi:hypothetical protein